MCRAFRHFPANVSSNVKIILEWGLSARLFDQLQEGLRRLALLHTYFGRFFCLDRDNPQPWAFSVNNTQVIAAWTGDKVTLSEERPFWVVGEKNKI